MEYYLRELQVLDHSTMESVLNCFDKDTDLFMIFDSYSGSLGDYYVDRVSSLIRDLEENKVSQLCKQKIWEF